MLWICNTCTTPYSPDAPQCPHCGGTDHRLSTDPEPAATPAAPVKAPKA